MAYSGGGRGQSPALGADYDGHYRHELHDAPGHAVCTLSTQLSFRPVADSSFLQSSNTERSRDGPAKMMSRGMASSDPLNQSPSQMPLPHTRHPIRDGLCN